MLPIPSRMKSGNASRAAKAMSFSQRVTSSDTEHPQGTAFTSENIQSKHESEPHKSTKRQLEHKHWNLKPIFNERHDWDCPWVTDMQHTDWVSSHHVWSEVVVCSWNWSICHPCRKAKVWLVFSPSTSESAIINSYLLLDICVSNQPKNKTWIFFRDHVLAGSVSSIIFLETTA